MCVKATHLLHSTILLIAVCVISNIIPYGDAIAKEPLVQSSSEASPYLFGRSFSNYYVGNLTIGNGYDYRPSFPFIADTSAEVESIVVYWVWDYEVEGTYSSGDGGTIRIEIVEDKNDLPTGKVVASGDVSPNIDFLSKTSDWSKKGYAGSFRENKLQSVSPTQKGKKYWVRFTNIASDPDGNYISINGLGGRVGSEKPLGYFGSQDDLNEQEGHFIFAWDDNGKDVYWDGYHEAIRQINYANGKKEGFGIVGGRYTSQYENRIQGKHRIRQTVVLPRDNYILNANIMIAKKSGHGDLTMTIEDVDGKVLSSDSVPSAEIPLQTDNPDGSPGDPNGAEFYGHRWISFPGITGFTMRAGQIYYAVLSAPDDTEYYAYGGQIGSVDYGFDEFIMNFKGHVAQHSSDGGETWTGWIHRGHPVRDVELGIYFNKGWSR